MKGECPCGSGDRYTTCCRPFHQGAEPPDVVKLMRSRFAAFALGEVPYLWRTLHSAHADRAGGEARYVADIRKSRQSFRYVRLSVLDHDVAADDQSGRVLFHAEMYERGKEHSFLELSTFQRDGGAWRYLSGVPKAMRASELERTGPMTIATCGLT